MNQPDAFIVAGSGSADAYQPALFEARIRNTIRFADPAAWITATAVAHALAGAGDLLAEWRHETGIIAIGDEGPGATMAEVEAVGLEGYSSPLRYAASSPGTLAGVSCIAFGLRGPTLNLTMAPAEGVPVALMMCAAWLGRKAARLMIVATCSTRDSVTSSRAVLLAPAGFSGPGAPLTAADTVWLASADGADAVPKKASS